VLLVTNDTKSPFQYQPVQSQDSFLPIENLLYGAADSDPYKWICSPQKQERVHTCNQLLADVKARVANNTWYVYGYHVNYCLAEKPLQRCKLEYSLPLASTVIVFNLVKSVIIGYTIISSTEQPILTMGDAVSSFIKKPDSFTRGQCLLSKAAVAKHRHRPRYKPLTFTSAPKRWRAAVSGMRLTFGIIA
jgi:hypothetical protein